MAAGRQGQLVWPATAQPVFSSSSTQYHPLGTLARDRYGREFRYALVSSAADLVAGNWIQAQAQKSEYQDMTPSDGAVDDRMISATPGAAAAAADLYADGIAVIDTTPGLGYSYPIKTHLANAGSVLLVLQLGVGWTVQVAITNASSRVSLYSNPNRNVIQGPATTLTSIPVGVAPYPIAASQFGWLGVHGQFGTLIQGTPAVGQTVVAPGSAAGAVAIQSSTLPPVGMIMDTGQDGKCEGVFWTL